MAEKSHPFPTWWAGAGWSIGLALWGLVAFVRRRRARHRISVPPLSERWLIEHELTSGRDSDT
ncbi:MAG: hypothetical protein HY654_00540 [Acidobacteria bacterium]|nr:hypothetical protein [Acidobacteriota bacterium]